MLFGSKPKLAKGNCLDLLMRDTAIFSTKSYKYLGVYLDQKLNMNDDFEKKVKKCSGRLRLLSKIRNYLTTHASKVVFQSMILPLFTYCGIVCSRFNNTQISRLTKLDDLASRIITSKHKSLDYDPPKFADFIQKRSCIVVFKCLKGEYVQSLFKDYFTIMDHEKCTRNNKFCLRIPRVNLESTKKCFSYNGAILFNSLPLDVRKSVSLKEFEEKLKLVNFT